MVFEACSIKCYGTDKYLFAKQIAKMATTDSLSLLVFSINL